MTTTAARKVVKVQPEEVLMDLDPAGRVYRTLSLERKRMFHENRRILIVDDMESTCRRLHNDLSRIYPESAGNVVEYEKNPVKARDKVIDAKKAGNPYDALVLDLFMEGLQGAQLMKDVHAAGAFVPIVVNTASMMDPVVSDTIKQFDNFRTRKVMEEWRDKNKKHFPRPVLFHDKFDGTLSSLVDMLDVAMLVGRKGIGDTETFLREFNPMLVESNFSAEVTHKIVEETRNCAGEVSGIIKQMAHDFPEFKKTGWWMRNGSRLERTLKELGRVSFRNTHADTPKETGDNLHVIANRMVFINGPDAERLALEGVGDYASNPKFKETVKRWNEAVREPYRMISQLFSGYREYHKPEVNVPVFARELVGDAGTVETPYPNLVVKGDKNALQELVRVPVQVAKKRVMEKPGSSMKVIIDYTKDIAESGIISDNERTRLSRMNCKRCCLMEVEDTAPSPASVDKTYGDFIFKLDSAEKTGLAAWTVETPEKGGLKMRVLLNLDAKKQE